MQVTIIGAGSATFSKTFIADILTYPEFKEGVTFSLMDVNPKLLKLTELMAPSIAKTLNAKVKVRATTDRRKALEGSDFVIVTIKAYGDTFHQDSKIPAKYGLKQTVADTVGTGGVFYGLRHMPLLVSIAKDMEKISPKAILLNYTNPVAMNTLAVLRATKIQTVGLCHSVQGTIWRLRMFASLGRLSRKEIVNLLGDNKYPMHWPYMPPKLSKWFYNDSSVISESEFFGLCAGINHMSAFVKLEWRGKDAYPLVRKAMEHKEVFILEPTRNEVFTRLGYYITESSRHLSEYTPWFMRHPEEVKRMMVFKRTPQEFVRGDWYGNFMKNLQKGEPLVQADRKISNEYASRIIYGVSTNTPVVINGNVHNRGGALISNLPGDSCVEVPCLVNHFGLHPIAVGDIPPQVAAMIRTNINVQDLAVRAVLEEDTRYVYQAVMMDPNTSAQLKLPMIWKMVDEMLKFNRKMIPSGLTKKRPSAKAK